MRKRLIDHFKSIRQRAPQEIMRSTPSASDLPYYRATLHQFWLFHWAEAEEQVFTYIEDALKQLAEKLPTDAYRALWAELSSKKGRKFEHDIRFPFVRSETLYPVANPANQEPLYVAFFAYQEGPDMLLHFIWFLDGQASADYFTQTLGEHLWTGPKKADGTPVERLGESILLSAVVEDREFDQSSAAMQLVQHFSHGESDIHALPVHLNGNATLYIQAQTPLNQTRSTTLLFYESKKSEESEEADQFATVEWPLVVLYQLRLEHLYLKRYRASLRRSLIQQNRTLRQVLNQHFATSDKQQLPRVFRDGSLRTNQQALNALSGPQYHQLERLKQAEEYAEVMQLELENLSQTLQRSNAFQHDDWQPITYQAQQDKKQLQSDITATRHLTERASSAITILQAQTDLLGTSNDRKLNFIIGIVGTALAVGQLVDTNAAAHLYDMTACLLNLSSAWHPFSLPALTETNKMTYLVATRFIATCLSIPIAWAVLTLYLRSGRR